MGKYKLIIWITPSFCIKSAWSDGRPQNKTMFSNDKTWLFHERLVFDIVILSAYEYDRVGGGSWLECLPSSTQVLWKLWVQIQLMSTYCWALGPQVCSDLPRNWEQNWRRKWQPWTETDMWFLLTLTNLLNASVDLWNCGTMELRSSGDGA